MTLLLDNRGIGRPCHCGAVPGEKCLGSPEHGAKPLGYLHSARKSGRVPEGFCQKHPAMPFTWHPVKMADLCLACFVLAQPDRHESCNVGPDKCFACLFVRQPPRWWQWALGNQVKEES